MTIAPVQDAPARFALSKRASVWTMASSEPRTVLGKVPERADDIAQQARERSRAHVAIARVLGRRQRGHNPRSMTEWLHALP